MSTQKDNYGNTVVTLLNHLHRSAKGEISALRNSNTLLAVRMTPAFISLEVRLEDAGFSVRSRDHVALCLGVMAQFRFNDSSGTIGGSKYFPKALSAGAESGSPVYKLQRFQRLIQLDNPSDLYDPMRRVIKHLGDDINPFRLAADMLYFGENVREMWAGTYHKTVLPTLSFGK